jgi:Beta-galactosidase
MALRDTLRTRTSATLARLAAAAAAAAAALPLALAPAAHAATTPMLYGTLDTQAATASAEAAAGVGMAMMEFDWADYEPAQGTFSASYLAGIQAQLKAYQAAGMKVTLGLGLAAPPSWVWNLANADYVDQNGTVGNEPDFVFSAAVRAAATTYLDTIAANIPLTDFWAIRLNSGGDGEMLYPGGTGWWAFTPSALTGAGLPGGVGKNPDPTWKPGTPGLTQAQLTAWITWYVRGLDNVTSWQMTTLTGLGFTGWFQTLTPGSGTRPDVLTAAEKNNLPADGTTNVGAVWQLYYAQLPAAYKTRVMAYVSSVADNSGGNDTCQAGDDSLALTTPSMDSWSATRWITRIAHQYALPVGGENPGYNDPASLDTFYTNTTTAGEMAISLAQARSCGFTVFYWAHDTDLHDGTMPFADYAAAIAG